jgi:4,5-dihydroxyphthalate decarboxylase
MPAQITLAHTYSDRIAALCDGTVQVPDVDLRIVRGTTETIFWRMLREQPYDAAEMSLTAYVVERSRGNDALVAVPVFPSRMFRHAAIYVREDGALHSGEDLAGLRIGIPDYQMTVGVWVRSFLTDDYRVAPSDVTWFTGGLESPGIRERIELRVPSGCRIQPIAADEDLVSLLLAGRLDALVAPRIPEACRPGGGVRRLFSNPAALEADYFTRTGIFPIMHTLVLRRSTHDELPWLAGALQVAFEKAKAHAWEALSENDYLPYGDPWVVEAQRATRELMGDDYWPYGVEKNGHVLRSFLDACGAQGLLEKPLQIEDLFSS